MNLKSKSNDNIISDLKEMIAKERGLLIQILHYLREVEERRLYLERGFSSLFAFVTEELGYSEGAAQRRIQTMRLIKDIPQVEEKLETGKLSLTVAAQVQGFIKQEEKKKQISNIEKLELVEKLEGTSTRICEKQLISISPETALPKEKTKILTEEKTLIQFVADQKLMKKIEKLKSLLSHQNINQKYDQPFEKLVDIALEKLDPEQRIERKISKSTPALAVDLSSTKFQARYIPQSIRDEIWVRDQGKCQYRDPKTGKVCGSQYTIQIDHIKPYAFGGNHHPENLQLLCGAHNRHRTKKISGLLPILC